MRSIVFDKNGQLKHAEELFQMKPKWALLYSNCESDFKKVITRMRSRFPNVDVFGMTSFQGVFTPQGFVDGGAILVGEDADDIQAFAEVVPAQADSARKKAKEIAITLKEKLKGTPDVLLMHATPGFEERVLEGINEIFHDDVPIFGGSAGDNDLTGKWKLFKNGVEVTEGILLVGFQSPNKIYGSFWAGYLPTRYEGRITKAKGRIVHEIDGRPAAEVYNEWTKGAISEYLEQGGVVLAQTTLHPIGRLVGKVFGTPLYVLSHPHQVIPETKSLSFFTEFNEGDTIVLMSGSDKALIDRTSRVASMALGFDKGKALLRGGILIYCAGCVGAVGDKQHEIVKEFKTVVGEIPFIGAATFGEQGCFPIDSDKNRHGNLMCDTILFSMNKKE